MMIALKMLIEVVFIIAITVCCYYYTQVKKRERYVLNILSDPLYLSSFIKPTLFSEPRTYFTKMSVENNLPRYIDFGVYISSDNSTNKKVKTTMVSIIAVVIIISFFLGVTFFIISLVLLCMFYLICSFMPLSKEGEANASEHLYNMGYMIYRWTLDNQEEADDFFEGVPRLKNLLQAVKTNLLNEKESL
jgi:hypothetical protein